MYDFGLCFPHNLRLHLLFVPLRKTSSFSKQLLFYINSYVNKFRFPGLVGIFRFAPPPRAEQHFVSTSRVCFPGFQHFCRLSGKIWCVRSNHSMLSFSFSFSLRAALRSRATGARLRSRAPGELRWPAPQKRLRSSAPRELRPSAPRPRLRSRAPREPRPWDIR